MLLLESATVFDTFMVGNTRHMQYYLIFIFSAFDGHLLGNASWL